MSSLSNRKGVPTTPLSAEVDAFLDDCIGRNLSLATLDAYTQMLHRFVQFIQEHYPAVTSISHVDASHVQGFRRWLRRQSARAGREVGLATQAKYLAAIRALLRYYSLEKGLTVLAREVVRLPKPEPRRGQQPISSQELANLLAQPKLDKTWGLRDRAIIALLAESGLRVSELCTINRRDVREELLGKHPTLEITPPSTRGIIRLGRQTQEFLREYLKSRDDHYPPLFVRHKPGKSQDQDDSQHRLTRQMIDRMLERYGRSAELATLPSARDLAPRRRLDAS
jgi:site-specific recombinase XerD